MFSSKLLRRSKVKELILKLEQYYKADLSILNKYNFYINENNGKVYLSNIDLDEIKFEKIMGKGIYFGTFHDEDRFRLSIEGSKYVIPTENFVKLKDENLSDYLSAKDLNVDEVKEVNKNDSNHAPFLIVIHNKENLGCVSYKESQLLNYIPKSRKIQEGKLF